MKPRSVPRHLVRKVDYWRRHIHVARGSVVASSVTIGSYTNINASSFIADCEIGSFVAIGGRLVVHSTNHDTKYANMQESFQRDVICSALPILLPGKGRVTIGSASWIGDSTIILPGGSVGIGAVVGAGSVVTKPLPDFSVSVGNPARVLRMRFSPVVIEYLLRVEWWQWDLNRLRRNRPFFEIDFSQVDDSSLDKISIRK